MKQQQATLTLSPKARAALEAPALALLLPYQQRWLLDPSPVKVFEKSRRIGITWATAASCVIEAASGRQNALYFVYNEDAGKEFITDCVAWAERLDAPCRLCEINLIDYDDDGRATNTRALGIKFQGSPKYIAAVTSNPRSLRGKRGRVIVDEAAFHSDLDEVLKSALATRVWEGEVWILSTHNGDSNPFAKLCDDIRDGKLPYSLHRCTIDDAIEEGLYQRICAVAGRAWSIEAERAWIAGLVAEYGFGVEEELYCRPSSGGASYLPREFVKACMSDDYGHVRRFSQDDAFMKLTEDERHELVAEWLEAEVAPVLDALRANKDIRASAFGYDVGRYADLGVLCVCCVRQGLKKRVPLFIELANVPYNAQWQVIQYVVKRLPHFLFGAVDATGTGSWLAEQAQIHLGGDSCIDSVSLNQSYYKEHWPPVKLAFETQALELPSDIDVMNDLLTVRRINGVPTIPSVRTDSTTAKGQKRHGDAAVALLLALTAAIKAEELHTRWAAYSTI